MAEKAASDGDNTRAELEALIDKLDEESLQFLKQQAEILIYSGELEEARKKAAEAARNINRVQKQRRRDSRTDAEAAKDAETGKAGSDEAGAPDAEEATPPEPPVSITRRSETSFLIKVTGTRVFFNRQEMRELTRIAHAAGDAADGPRTARSRARGRPALRSAGRPYPRRPRHPPRPWRGSRR